MVSGLGFGVWGLWFRVRVWGLGFRVSQLTSGVWAQEQGFRLRVLTACKCPLSGFRL